MIIRPILTTKGIVFRKYKKEVGYGGVSTTFSQVLGGDKGYYIGRLWFDDKFGVFTPIVVLKTVYWEKREEAESSLINSYK